jgi:hypothetical protein
MTYCDVHASGDIELYFYGELDGAEHQDVARHVRACSACRQALEDLALIREALETRPDVSAPPGGDWSGFTTRLDEAVRQERRSQQAAATVVLFDPRPQAIRPSYAGYLAMAALLALVTMSVLFVARSRDAIGPAAARDQAPPAIDAAPRKPHEADPGLATASEKHFERSKLVLLGLATKDSKAPASWDYERDLATALLNDTRLYRMAAEDRGMARLAGVLRDLELVLLQTSMSEKSDSAGLAQIQRLIRKRDLLGQMETVSTNTGS